MKLIPQNAKPLLNSLKNKCKQPFVQCVLLALVLNVFVEIMSRRSVFKAIGYLFTNPLVFLYNTLIILTTLSIALFFKRRNFVYFIISLLWVAIGVTDFILLQFRTTPFTAVDITLMKSALQIWHYYLKWFHLVLIAVGLLLAVFACVVVWKKAKKYETRLPLFKVSTFFAIAFISATTLTKLGLQTNLLAANFGNLANAYHQYGLPYCFVNSVINTGIDKPEMYSTDVVNTIVEGVEQGKVVLSTDISPTAMPEPTVTPSPAPTVSPTPPIEISASAQNTEATEETPNIIFLQLESFFDPTHIKGVTFTEDPVPNYRALKENFTSGYLSVPSVGAGTANTEFEVITGMNLDFFGPGEYPYKTILQKTSCESLSFNLKPLGYTTHAMHNNVGTFYDRNTVFSQLGFDTFTSIEYMQDIERTPNNWAKDKVLTSEILQVLNTTKNQDFIYAISVQGHGSYPDSSLIENASIDLTLSEDLPESLYYPLLYYTNQIKEMDDFIGELLDSLTKRDEKTIVVMYGDHLPGFQLEDTDLTNGSLFQTEYIMWSNFEMEQIDEDLEAYQLSAHILDRLDIHNGLITKLHQTQKDSDIYLEELKILEYDMLYGDLDCFNGVNPYEKTDLKMGTLPILISEAHFSPAPEASETDEEKPVSTVVVTGSNFTPYSKIQVNDKIYETKFINRSLLSAPIDGLTSGDVVTVIQSGNDNVPLSSTAPYLVP